MTPLLDELLNLKLTYVVTSYRLSSAALEQARREWASLGHVWTGKLFGLEVEHDAGGL